MKRYFNIGLVLFVSVVISSCQKVIHVDLNSSSPQIIIEGLISDQPGPNTVKLTKTVNFDQSNVFPGVSGALVKISDDAGNSEVLTETSKGIYSTLSLTGVPGRTYTLSVTANGKEYRSTSLMPAPVAIDTLEVLKNSRPNQGESDRRINLYFKDPANVVNYYKFYEVVNGVSDNTISLENDELRDGEEISTRRFSQNELMIESGDSVVIVLESISKGTFDYFATLSDAMGGGFGAAPANPTSNITNGALGYFSAYSVTSKGIVIP